MSEQPLLTKLNKVKARGVTYRGPYLGRGGHVGVAFDCEDIAAVMRLGAAISKRKNLAPLLGKGVHSDNMGRGVVVSFDVRDINPYRAGDEATRLSELIAEVLDMQNQS